MPRLHSRIHVRLREHYHGWSSPPSVTGWFTPAAWLTAVEFCGTGTLACACVESEGGGHRQERLCHKTQSRYFAAFVASVLTTPWPPGVIPLVPGMIAPVVTRKYTSPRKIINNTPPHNESCLNSLADNCLLRLTLLALRCATISSINRCR